MNGDLAALWPEVAAARLAFLDAIADVSEAQARVHPGGGEAEWCVLQVAQHLLGWTENMDDVIAGLAEGRVQHKNPPGFLPPDPPPTLADVRDRLTRASVRFLALPERLPVAVNLEAVVQHPRYGALNCRDWFARSAAHDAEHRAQVEAVKRGL